MTTSYGKGFYGEYPIQAADGGSEPAFRRTSSMPQPIDVYNFALLGLSKVFPITGEAIPLYLAEDALMSSIAEIEMSTGMNISPVDHYQSEDFINGKSLHNYTGTRLMKWPATKIIKMSFKYPFSFTNKGYAEYVIPPHWLYLNKNNVNVMPSTGTLSVSQTTSGPFTVGAVYSFIFGNDRYVPGSIEILYTAGFEPDKLPANLVDLIKTSAAHRMLMDLLPILYPQSGVSVSIDGVSQSVQFNITQMLQKRLEDMEMKKKQLISSLKNQYKSALSMTFIGT